MQLRNALTWFLLLTVIIATIANVDAYRGRRRRRSGSWYGSRRRSSWYGHGSRRQSRPSHHHPATVLPKTLLPPTIKPRPASGGAEQPVDVVIVGAGVSGLTAAYRLKEKGRTYKVIETRTRVGGRTNSTEISAANGVGRWDLGGQWVGTKQYNVKKLLKELGIRKYKQYTNGSTLFIMPDGNALQPTDPTPDQIQDQEDYEKFIAEIDALADTVDVNSPESHPHAYVLDSMTLADFMRMKAIMVKPLYKGLFSNIIRAVFTAEPNEISFLFFLQVIQSGESWTAHTTSGVDTAQEELIVGTAHTISLRLYEEIGAEHVILGDTVTKITQRLMTTMYPCVVTTKKGHRIKSRYVIVATPPGARTRITFQPDLPVNYHDLNHHYVAGFYGKMFFTYKTAFWREQGLSGDAFGCNQPAMPRNSMVNAPILATSDASHTESDGEFEPALVVFAHPKLLPLQEPKLQKVIQNGLVKLFGTKADNPIGFALQEWYGNDTPVINCSPGGLSNFGRLVRQPFLRIHWAGTEAATSWIGYIDGAVQSGQRAADEVIGRMIG